MVDLNKRKADRLRVMNEFFEAASGSEQAIIDTEAVQTKLGLSDQEMADACKYLEGEELIRLMPGLWGGRPFPHRVLLTHWGIREVEESREHPEAPTEHFPPQVTVTQHFHGDVIGSPIQAGSPGATQTTTVGDLNLELVREVVDQYEKDEVALGLDASKAEEARAEVKTIGAQLDSPRPKPAVIRESLTSLRALVEGAAGSMAAVGLLSLLARIHI
jgi:hypothetical protein